jgi:signal transduction histidine kinase
MKDERKVNSIARRINRYWLRRTLLLMGLIDGVLGAMIAGGWITVAASSFWPALAGVEVLLILLQGRVGKDKSQRLMEPLERIAQTAEELSRARFDPEKLHHLEDAIGTVSPLSPDAHVYTGDKEMQGLETAINNMLARTPGNLPGAEPLRVRRLPRAAHPHRRHSGLRRYAAPLGKDDETVLEEGISAIQSESTHMKKLIEQLLFLARGDNGRTQLTLEPVDISQMLAEVYEESKMIHPDRQWRLDADTSIFVTGDADMLKQTARILVDNAVKYTQAGDKISLRARMKDGAPCFEVQDNGIGIKQEDLAHIFDRFFRSDPARARATGGTGLGLSIAKWIVERHGGYFDVFSREEFGTRIGVVLPQKETNDA